jgi:hypothetical protein
MKTRLHGSVARFPLAFRLLVVLLAISQSSGAVRPSLAAGRLATDPLDTLSALRITEIMYNPSGGQEYEFIEIKNTGATSLSLGGVAFVAGIAYTFPAGARLDPGAFAVLVQDPAAFASRYPGIAMAGVYSGRLDNAGERVTLSDPTGATLIELTYDDNPPWPASADGLGYSLVLANAAGDPNLASTWRASTLPNGSPGRDDPEPIFGAVVINEVLAHSDPPYEDAIELYNPSNDSIHVGGWFLSDDAADLRKYRIADGVMLPPKGYAVFYAYQFNPTPGVPPSFGLSASGDELHLAAANPDGSFTGYNVSFEFGASDVNISLGRYVTSAGIDYPALLRPTFGVDHPASVQQFRTGAGATNAGPRIGPVVINELHYHPVDGVDEFLELLNISGSGVMLYDPLSTTDTWRMTEGISYTFPANTVLPAGQAMLLVPIEPAVFRATYGIPGHVPILGPYSGSLSNGGERVELARPGAEDQGVVRYLAVDSILYDDQAPWLVEPDGNGPSLERVYPWMYGNEPANWSASTITGGTPGLRNTATPVLPWSIFLPAVELR